MKCFAKLINDLKPLSIFAKHPISDVCREFMNFPNYGNYNLLNNGYLHFLEHPSKQHFCSPGHSSSEPHLSSVTPRHLNGGCGLGHFPFFTEKGEC